MNHAFGPWTSSLDIGQQPQLSAFWRQRLMRLPMVAQSVVRMGRPTRAALAIVAVTILGLPTLCPKSIAQQLAAVPAARPPSPPAEI